MFNLKNIERSYSTYRPSILYLSQLLIITALAYWPISFNIFSLKNDALNYFLPVRYLVSESYNYHILPLWTPYLNLGYPLHGDMQSGVWNPIVQLFSQLGPYTLYTLQIETLLYIFLSGAGVFFLLKHFKIHPFATMLSSIAFMLCGFNSDSCQFLNWIAATAFLPFVFLFYFRCLFENSVRQGVYTAISLFFLFNCAYPADFILTIYLMAAMIIWNLWKKIKYKETGFLIKMIVPHLVLVIIFLLLAGPAILSYYESLPLTERGTGASFSNAMSNPLHPALLSSYTTPLSIWKMSGVGITDPLLRNSYIGIVGFIILIVAYSARLNSFATFCKWAGVIFLLFSFGELGGIRILAYYFLPMMDTFRHPANARMFTTFFFCILMGLTYHAILNGEINRKHLKRGVILTILISLIVLLYSLLTPFSFFAKLSISEMLSKTFGSISINNVYEQFQRFSYADLVLITTLIQLPFIFIAYQSLIQRLHPKLFLGSAIANCILFTMLFQPFTVVKKQRASFIQDSINSHLVKGYPLPDNQYTLEENSLENEKYILDIGCQSLYNKKIGRSDYRITPSNLLSQNTFWFHEDFRKKMMQNQLIYESNKDLNPAQKNKDDTRRAIIKEFQSTNNETTNQPTTFSFTRFEPNHFEILINSSSNGSIVLMQNYYPRWKLYIDDKPAPIQKVNITFMGFFLQKGEHNVTFRYEANDIRIAFVVSLIVSGLLLIYIFLRTFNSLSIVRRKGVKLLNWKERR